MTPSELEAIEQRDREAGSFSPTRFPDTAEQVQAIADFAFECALDRRALCQKVRRLQQVEQAARKVSDLNAKFYRISHDGREVVDAWEEQMDEAFAALRSALQKGNT